MANVVVLGAGLSGTIIMAYELVPQLRKGDQLSLIGQGRLCGAAADAAELEPQVRLLKLNADEAPGVAAEFNVTGIPVAAARRAAVARNAGVMDARHIVAWTRGHLAHAA